MAHEIVFTSSGQDALAALEHTEQSRVRRKLDRIATCEIRAPWEWGFCRMEGRADGRFWIGDGLRVFADIDRDGDVIRVRHVGRRENLYT